MSTLSATIKQRARALAAGVALTATTLAILPGVAEAQALRVDPVRAAQGGNAVVNTSQDIGGRALGVSADSNLTSQASGGGNITAAPVQGSGSTGLATSGQQAIGAVQGVSTGLADRAGHAATVESSTVATESVALAERPLVNGAVNSTTEAVAPAVPAQGTATVNENVAAGDAVNQDVCLNAALNQEARSCGGSGGDTGTTLGTDAGNLELAAPEATVDSGTTVAEDAAVSERPRLDGSVDNATRVAAPTAPVEGTAAVDENVTAGDLVNQDVCLNAGVNAPAGECGTAAPQDGPATTSHAVDGDVNSGTGVDAPAVPAEGETTVDTSAVADGLANIGACLNAGANQEPGSCEQTAPNDSGDGADPATADPAVNGDANGSVGVDAPTAPASGGATVDSSVVAGDLAGLDACLGVGVNQDPSACGDPAAGGNPADGDSHGDGGADPAVDGDVDGSVGVEAPLPAEGGTTLDADAAVGNLAAASVCLNAGVNQDPGACEGPASADDGTTPDSGQMPSGGDGNPAVTGDVNSAIGIDAPGVPAEGGATLDADAVAAGVASLDACVNAGVNQEPGSCDEQAARDDSGDGTTSDDGGNYSASGGNAPDGGGNGSVNSSGDSGSGDDAGNVSDPGNRGPANDGAASDGGAAGDDHGSVDTSVSGGGSSSAGAGSPGATESPSAGAPDSVYLLMSDSAPSRAVPTSMTGVGSQEEASSLQASEQSTADSSSTGATTLPDTGGADLRKAILGFFLLTLGLLVVHRARRSSLMQ